MPKQVGVPWYSLMLSDLTSQLFNNISREIIISLPISWYLLFSCCALRSAILGWVKRNLNFTPLSTRSFSILRALSYSVSRSWRRPSNDDPTITIWSFSSSINLQKSPIASLLDWYSPNTPAYCDDCNNSISWRYPSIMFWYSYTVDICLSSKLFFT